MNYDLHVEELGVRGRDRDFGIDGGVRFSRVPSGYECRVTLTAEMSQEQAVKLSRFLERLAQERRAGPSADVPPDGFRIDDPPDWSSFSAQRNSHAERQAKRQAKQARQQAMNDFVGFVEEWRAVLGFPPRVSVTRAEVERAFRERAKAAHPDRGGSHDEMVRLNQARESALGVATP